MKFAGADMGLGMKREQKRRRVKYGYFPGCKTMQECCRLKKERAGSYWPEQFTAYQARRQKADFRKSVRTMHCPVCGGWHIRWRDRIGESRAFINARAVLWKTLARWKANLKFIRSIDHSGSDVFGDSEAQAQLSAAAAVVRDDRL